MTGSVAVDSVVAAGSEHFEEALLEAAAAVAVEVENGAVEGFELEGRVVGSAEVQVMSVPRSLGPFAEVFRVDPADLEDLVVLDDYDYFAARQRAAWRGDCSNFAGPLVVGTAAVPAVEHAAAFADSGVGSGGEVEAERLEIAGLLAWPVVAVE